jgi:hypothetical protein
MPHPTGPRLLLLVVILTAFTAAPRGARGEVASTTLQKLSAQAKAIAIARVDKVQGIGGVRVATATVLRPLKGMRAQQRFAFLAQGTWTCDESYATAGETVLIFLEDPSTSGFVSDYLSMRPWFGWLRSRRLPGLAFYRIAHSGAGRIPVQFKHGQGFLMARSPYSLTPHPTPHPDSATLRMGLVKLPSGIPAFQYLTSDGWTSYLVPLRDVETRVQMWVGPLTGDRPAASVH